MSNIYCPKGSVLIHYASPYYDPVKAHEYYMEHRKLKGRNFNDAGKEASSYVKKRLDDEKKQLIEEHRVKTNQGIDYIKGATDSRMKTLRDQTTSDVKAISEQAKNERQRLSDKTKKDIESKSKETTSKIDSLRRRLSSMSKTQRLLNKDKIAEEIARLREDNANTRTSLQYALRKSQGEISERASRDSANRRASGKEEVDYVREVRNQGVKEQRDAHTQYRKDITEQYNKKYQDELDRMSEDKSFQAVKKSGSSRNSTKRKMK